MTERFDAAYYERHYFDPETAVISREEAERLVRFVITYLEYLEINVDSVLDLGCGVGLWAPLIDEVLPRATYTGVEVSEYLCEHYGWVNASVADYGGEQADLVVCQGVLQYLDKDECKRAIDNLAAHTSGALYLEALTAEDWEQNCDQSITDGDVHLRPAKWYRKRLGKHFVSCGGGLFVPKDSGVVLYELERG